jgi:hypothetical protein
MAKGPKVYRYEPVLFDRFTERTVPLAEGTLVVKGHPGYGAPKNGTMGMCYVYDADDGTFYGLVMLNSLVPA